MGIDIGGTKCTVSQWHRGRAVEIFRCPTQDPATTLRLLSAAIESQVPRPHAIGIACGGPLDAARGIILSPPNLPGWDRIRITSHFERRLRCPAFLMNDANANALAEWHFGAGRDSRVMIFLTAGTGMGAGIVIDGQLLEGVCGNAGEVGHVRLAATGPTGFHKAGSFEGFCSGSGLAQLVEFLPRGVRPRNWRAWQTQHPTAHAIALAARRGDPTARAIFAESGRRLGQALSLLIDTLNPDRIVIGSLWLRCRDLLGSEMRRVVRAETLADSRRACRIVPSALGESLGNYGAVAVALRGLQQSAQRT